MAGVVDADEGEGAALLGLAVDEEVRGGDVDVAGNGGVAGDADGVVDGFAAEPVACFEISLLAQVYGYPPGGGDRGGLMYCCNLHRRIPL